LAYENLNVILVIAGLCLSIAVPFIMRGFSKRDKNLDKVRDEYIKRQDQISERLDKYEERLRLAEIEIVRNANNVNRINNRNGNNR
jgi:hypothetical protein